MKFRAVIALRGAGRGLCLALATVAVVTVVTWRPQPCLSLPSRPPGSPPLVVLEVEPCLPVDPVQVRHLVAIELGAQLLDTDPSPPTEARGLIRARVGCRDALVELHVDDGVTGKELVRAVDLARQDPAVHPRLIAVALAELVFASWAELLVTPRPAVQPATPPPPPATRAASSDRVARKLPPALPDTGIHGSAIGSLLFLFSGAPVLAGGGLRLGGDHRRHVSWDFDFSALHGVSSTALGKVTTDLLSSRATLMGHYRLPHLLLRGGAGLRMGAARMSGSPIDPMQVEARSVWALWGGPLVGLGLSAAAARLRIDLSFEAGYVLWPVAARVSGVRQVALEDAWFGLTLGLGAHLH